jgi:hypothetical protein
MLDSPFRLGQRISIQGDRATIKFIGSLDPESNQIWLGVEWDNPSRGKHSGSINGICYFKSSVENAASFLRLSNKIEQSCGFVKALKEKYLETEAEDVILDFGNKKSNFVVETVGWKKISLKQQQLDQLEEIGLSAMLIGFLDLSLIEFRTIGKNIVDLDLSKNLFEDWKSVFEIGAGLPRLKSLRLGYNRFRPVSADDFTDYPAAFNGIKTLELNSTLITWDDMLTLEPFLPNLEALHFGWNKLKTFCSIHGFRNLRKLYLECNEIHEWAEIDKLSGLPRLDTLNLIGNQIKTIPPPTQSPYFKNLSSLNINENLIEDWMSVHSMNFFVSLRELRIKRNPFFNFSNTRSVVDRKNLYLTGRIGNVSVLNGSELTARYRLDAELYYLQACAQDKLSMSPAEFSVYHPRYSELIKKYGEVEAVETQNDSLEGGLLKLTLEFDNQQFVKSVPGSIKVQMLYRLIAKQFKKKTIYLKQVKAANNDRLVDVDDIDPLKEADYYFKTGDVLECFIR